MSDEQNERAHEDLELLRARILELDGEILHLLGERFAHVRLLGRWKALAGLPAENPAREAELRAFYLQAAEREGLEAGLVLRILEAVLEHSKREQRAQERRPKSA
jgi:chorismate mutase